MTVLLLRCYVVECRAKICYRDLLLHPLVRYGDTLLRCSHIYVVTYVVDVTFTGSPHTVPVPHVTPRLYGWFAVTFGYVYGYTPFTLYGLLVHTPHGCSGCGTRFTVVVDLPVGYVRCLHGYGYGCYHHTVAVTVTVRLGSLLVTVVHGWLRSTHGLVLRTRLRFTGSALVRLLRYAVGPVGYVVRLHARFGYVHTAVTLFTHGWLPVVAFVIALLLDLRCC